MKKNLMTVIILALVLVNLVLTAILAFTIIPQTRKSNQLIDKIASAIDLELEDGSSKDTAAVPVEDIEVYDIEASFTVNLSPSGDGKDHVAVFSIGLSLNTKSDGYKSIGTEGLKAKETLIKMISTRLFPDIQWNSSGRTSRALKMLFSKICRRCSVLTLSLG